MGAFEFLKKAGDAMLPHELHVLDTFGELAGGAYDYATGDKDGAHEHMQEAKWNAIGMLPGGSLFDLARNTKRMDEKPAPEKPTDYGGTGAKWGAMAALPFGPLGWAAGTMAGGAAGRLLAPKAAGGFAPKDFSALAEKSLHPEAAATPGPYDHYAD